MDAKRGDIAIDVTQKSIHKIFGTNMFTVRIRAAFIFEIKFGDDKIRQFVDFNLLGFRKNCSGFYIAFLLKKSNDFTIRRACTT